ncbi:hypothetical protein HDU98_007326 [Podochytrium sp. JEL0797]|nr:hypothetical protein HDU98_007326 [Podochytrium sp. JEL0797]
MYLPVIGLEVHAQIRTASKLFSAAPSFTSRLTDAPNQNVSLFDAAFPGTLPRLNPECVRLATKAALALDSQIQPVSTFDRKHYFYPDLPLGYQITQHFQPFSTGGFMTLTKHDGIADSKRFRIQQIQIEQDSGKLVQSISGANQVLVDLNRAGVGVLEIVTEPDFSSGEEVVAFMKKMQRLLWHIGVSSSEMDEGAWRCDVNISVKKVGDAENGVRTELKHVSKFAVVKTAIEYEVSRQIALLESSRPVLQETMGLDSNGHTIRLRGKEDAPDYRYMPEPDLPAIVLTPELIETVRRTVPESLDARRDRLESVYGMSTFHIGVLMDEPGAVEYYEELAKNRDKSKTLNWLTSVLFAHLNKNDVRLTACPISVSAFGELIDLVEAGKLSGIRGKDVLAIMFEEAMNADGEGRDVAVDKKVELASPLAIAQHQDWLIAGTTGGDAAGSDLVLEKMIDDLLTQHPLLVQEIQAGKTRKLKFFSGQVMSKTRGKADPVLVDRVLRQRMNID